MYHWCCPEQQLGSSKDSSEQAWCLPPLPWPDIAGQKVWSLMICYTRCANPPTPVHEGGPTVHVVHVGSCVVGARRHTSITSTGVCCTACQPYKACTNRSKKKPSSEGTNLSLSMRLAEGKTGTRQGRTACSCGVIFYFTATEPVTVIIETFCGCEMEEIIIIV